MTDQDYAEIFRKLESSYNSLLAETGAQLREMLFSFEEYRKAAEAAGLLVWNEKLGFPTRNYPFYTLHVNLSRNTNLL